MYSDRKRVRKYGYKVSTSEYQKKALRVIELEDGIPPASLIYKIAFEPNDAKTVYLREKMFDLINFYIEQDRQSRVA